MELGPWNGSVRCPPSFKFCCVFSLFSWEAIALSWPNYFFYDPSLQTVPEESSQIFLRVGEIEYTHRSGEYWVGWVKPLLAIGNGKDGQWLSAWEWVSSLPVENRTAAARCVYDCHAKKALSWDNATLELRTGSFSHAEENMQCQSARTLVLCPFQGFLQGRGVKH